ncbi:MAG: hypothetical protein AB7I59_21255 [Geminicoccaceae bacterium]
MHRIIARSCARPLESALALLLVLSGCATVPTRPEIATPPAAGTVDGTLLVGIWICRDLNPLAGQPVQPITTRYAENGRFHSVSELPARGGMGPFRLGQQGRWSIEGNRLVTSEVKTVARSADDNTEMDAMAQAGAELVDLLAGDTPQASEIVKLDHQELILRPTGIDDPPVIGCSRRT